MNDQIPKPEISPDGKAMIAWATYEDQVAVGFFRRKRTILEIRDGWLALSEMERIRWRAVVDALELIR